LSTGGAFMWLAFLKPKPHHIMFIFWESQWDKLDSFYEMNMFFLHKIHARIQILEKTRRDI
jgi:hypothetical protein